LPPQGTQAPNGIPHGGKPAGTAMIQLRLPMHELHQQAAQQRQANKLNQDQQRSQNRFLTLQG
jgi:hypothetical protein